MMCSAPFGLTSLQGTTMLYTVPLIVIPPQPRYVNAIVSIYLRVKAAQVVAERHFRCCIALTLSWLMVGPGWGGNTMGGLMPRLHAPECACVILTVQAGDATVHTGDDYQRHTWQSTTSLVPVGKLLRPELCIWSTMRYIYYLCSQLRAANTKHLYLLSPYFITASVV
jgi:hypothetical protein